MADFKQLVGLFLLGAGIAAALPRPIAEDKRVLRKYRKSHPRRKGGGVKKPGSSK